MNKIYLVCGVFEHGLHDETWNLKAFKSKKKAEEFAEQLQQDLWQYEPEQPIKELKYDPQGLEILKNHKFYTLHWLNYIVEEIDLE
jgi:hypothetical protein